LQVAVEETFNILLATLELVEQVAVEQVVLEIAVALVAVQTVLQTQVLAAAVLVMTLHMEMQPVKLQAVLES
jgi:hypothetical protein